METTEVRFTPHVHGFPCDFAGTVDESCNMATPRSLRMGQRLPTPPWMTWKSGKNG